MPLNQTNKQNVATHEPKIVYATNYKKQTVILRKKPHKPITRELQASQTNVAHFSPRPGTVSASWTFPVGWPSPCTFFSISPSSWSSQNDVSFCVRVRGGKTIISLWYFNDFSPGSIRPFGRSVRSSLSSISLYFLYSPSFSSSSPGTFADHN